MAPPPPSNQRFLVGYGTLLYRASLGDTIGGEAQAKPMRPVIVPGFRRLFNLRPDHYEASSVLSDAGIENGAMNVEPADGFTLNGLAFPVSEEELADLDKRERYYRRAEVRLLDFKTRKPAGVAEIYASDPGERWIEREPQRLLPLWRDVEWARAGAYTIGLDFGRYFDETTFLADGKTRVVDHYSDLIETVPSPVPRRP